MLFSPDIMIDMFTKYGGMFMKGAGMALLLSLITIVMSMIFGTLVALARMSKVAPLRWLVSIYIEIFRSTPLMVQVMVIYFGAAAMGWKIQVPFMRDFNSFFWGLLCLILNSSAYVAEIVRSGIGAVNAGQIEAARSLGMSHVLALRLVILPQAVRNILPAMMNEFVAIIGGRYSRSFESVRSLFSLYFFSISGVSPVLSILFSFIRKFFNCEIPHVLSVFISGHLSVH